MLIAWKQKVLGFALLVLIFSGCSGQSRGSDPSASPTNIVLSGIMHSSDGASLAIMNGRTVKEGDVVDGFTVKTITQDHVLMVKGDREFKVEPTVVSGNPVSANSGSSVKAPASMPAQVAVMAKETAPVVPDEQEELTTKKKKEYLTLALSHEQQAYSLSGQRQGFYHFEEAINNYKYALSLETDRLAKTDIELKIQRLEERMRRANNNMNESPFQDSEETDSYSGRQRY